MSEDENEQEPGNVLARARKYAIPACAVVLLGICLWWSLFSTAKIKKESETRIQELQSLFDKLKSDKIALQSEVQELKKAKEELEHKQCTGIWKEGVCSLRTCTDSDAGEGANSIYIRGKVTYTDETGATKETSDECTPNIKQVLEGSCYESPEGSGNFLFQKKPVDCPTKDCVAGACIKRKGKK